MKAFKISFKVETVLDVVIEAENPAQAEAMIRENWVNLNHLKEVTNLELLAVEERRFTVWQNLGSLPAGKILVKHNGEIKQGVATGTDDGLLVVRLDETGRKHCFQAYSR